MRGALLSIVVNHANSNYVVIRWPPWATWSTWWHPLPVFLKTVKTVVIVDRIP